MKAAFYSKYGGPDVISIKDVEAPLPKENEIIIKVHASTFNRSDCALVSGPFIIRLFMGRLFSPKNNISGTDFAGSVEKVGKNVTAFKAGDRVFGFDDMGLASHAQYMAISAHKAMDLIPSNVSYNDAAASLEAVHYAINFLNKVTVKAGQKVLVNGATGGIGSALVQLLAHQKVAVTATCSTLHLDLVRSLGAQKVIDYTQQDFTKDAEKYDFVFDSVGKSTFNQCKPLLQPHGIYISSELGPYSQNVFFALLTPLLGGKKVVFPIPFDIKASITYIKKMLQEDTFKPVIDRQYTIDQIPEAYAYVASGQKVGNVIIHINS